MSNRPRRIRLLVLALSLGVAAGGMAPVSATAPASQEQPRRHGGEVPLLGRMSPEERAEAKQAARRRRPAPVEVQEGAAVPQEEREFLGISGKLRNGDIAPSDTIGAAGPQHVLTAVNIDFALWDKAATGEPVPLFGPTPLIALFPEAPPELFVFDPKVVYDPYRDHYVLVFLGAKGPGFPGGGTRDSRIFVVTIPGATAEAPETWCRRDLAGDQVAGFRELWADYPLVGFDADRLYVSTNQFTFTDRFRYAQILALDKDSLYDCGRQPSVTVFAQDQTRDPQGHQAFTIQPAVTVTESGARPAAFLLSFQDVECGGACGRRLVLWRIKEQNGTLRLRKRLIPVGLQRLAPYGTQQGGGQRCGGNADGCWDTGDLRLINAFYDADRKMLLAAHAIRKNVGGAGYVESSIRWYDVNPAPLRKASLRRKGLIGAAGRDAGWPVMASDAAGNVFATYSRGGAPKNEWLSAVAATIPPGSTAARPRKLRDGEARYERIANGPERWGDYNGINREPGAPDKIWTVNQYARREGPGATRIWQQVVQRISFR